jgi:hypothetical protein
LSKVSANALGKWIAVSGKKPADYIFFGRGTTGDIETVRASLLGHAKIESTARYLRIAKRSDPIALSGFAEGALSRRDCWCCADEYKSEWRDRPSSAAVATSREAGQASNRSASWNE